MVKNSMAFVKGMFVLGIVVFLVVSIIFSMRSFTGYVTTEEVHSGLNGVSFALFALGMLCTFVYLRKFRVKRENRK